MKRSRRSFLAFLGIGATVPVLASAMTLGNMETVPRKRANKLIKMANVPPGARVAIFVADTMEEVFNDVFPQGGTLELAVPARLENHELIFRCRKAGFLPMECPVPKGQYSMNLPSPTEDRIYTGKDI